MRISRFTEPQIVKVLKEVEGGRQVMEVMEVCREYGISAASYYNWKAETLTPWLEPIVMMWRSNKSNGPPRASTIRWR